MTVYSQNWMYDVMLSVDSWGSLRESKNTSQSVTSKLLPAPFCLYLNGFLHRFFVFHLLPISRMRCTLPSMCHLHCNNNVVERWNRWRTVADWGGVRRGRANLKSSSTVRSADGERAALKHICTLTSANHVYVPNKMWFVLSTNMHSPPGYWFMCCCVSICSNNIVSHLCSHQYCPAWATFL
jgi:hypothetical protein